MDVVVSFLSLGSNFYACYDAGFEKEITKIEKSKGLILCLCFI